MINYILKMSGVHPWRRWYRLLRSKIPQPASLFKVEVALVKQRQKKRAGPARLAHQGRWPLSYSKMIKTQLQTTYRAQDWFLFHFTLGFAPKIFTQIRSPPIFTQSPFEASSADQSRLQIASNWPITQRLRAQYLLLSSFNTQIFLLYN